MKVLQRMIQLSACLFAAVFNSTSQNKVAILDKISSQIVADIQKSQGEWAYAHVDKSFYTAGNTIWFRVYLLQQQSNSFKNVSKLIFADIIGSDNTVIAKEVFNSSYHELNGGIRLPATIREGQYYLRIYTEKILQQQRENAFVYPIYVFNYNSISNDNPVIRQYSSVIPESKHSAKIFVEGNNLISGVDNSVIVVAKNPDGSGAKVSGTVKDTTGRMVTGFQTSLNGFAKFLFKPNKQLKYTVTVKFTNNTEQTIELPSADDMAFQLSLASQDSAFLHFRVALGDKAYKSNALTYITGVAGDKVLFAAYGNGMYMADVPRKDFPRGPATFLLYDEQQKEVSRRVVWINNKNYNLSITTDKERYPGRRPVQMNLSLTDNTGNPAEAILSVSVTDDNAVSPVSFSSSLPFISLLRNTVPDYSVCPDNILDSEEAIDMQMIALVKKSQLTYSSSASAIDTALIIAGKVMKSPNTALANEEIIITSSGISQISKTVRTDAYGNFTTGPVNFYDSTRFMITSGNNRVNSKELVVIPEPSFQVDEFVTPKNNFCPAPQPVQQSAKQYFRVKADSFSMYSTDAWKNLLAGNNTQTKESKRNKFTRSITREQLKKYSMGNLANAVLSVPGVILMNGRLTIRGGMPVIMSGAGSNNIEPLVIIDGVSAGAINSVVEYLNGLNPDMVEEIEVFTGPEGALFGSRSGNGVISIKTRQTTNDEPGGDGYSFFRSKGYHIAPAFAVPPYDNEKILDAGFNDNRATIYWNGEVFTANGKANLRFYTSDATKTFTVTVMGMTASGDLIYETMKLNQK